VAGLRDGGDERALDTCIVVAAGNVARVLDVLEAERNVEDPSIGNGRTDSSLFFGIVYNLMGAQERT